jgi:DNA ligase-1
MKTFRPMLAPNEEIDIKSLKFPLLASYKLDGIRCIFKDGQMYSRALKQFPNIKLRERFEGLNKFCKAKDIILDGELLAKSLEFNELSGLTRQLDKVLPFDLYFYCFDAIFNKDFMMSFRTRTTFLDALVAEIYHSQFKIVKQWSILRVEDINPLYENALAWGCDGLILRDLNGRYKFGRGTIKEGLIYKMKPFQTFDSKIIDVLQGTIVNPKAEKTINELGYSRTSKLKEDRLPSGRASDFVVKYKGKELKVSIVMTQEEKEEVWKNKEKYIDRLIEYKGMLVGAKDLPRHPIFLRFREDK